ncbi:MAG: hypothetical protein HY913_07235 [Desulfomonile tiedjei]|nr:hypothetical protein [Desulfomonile tiedjei]
MNVGTRLGNLICTVAAAIFWIALECETASTFIVYSGAVQHAGSGMQITTQQPGTPKTMAANPKDPSSPTTPLPIGVNSLVACYSGCVTLCNPGYERQEQQCQQRCAAHCWKE